VLDAALFLPTKGAQQPPLFGPCLLWPQSPMSAIAELVCLCMKYLGEPRQIHTEDVFGPSLR